MCLTSIADAYNPPSLRTWLCQPLRIGWASAICAQLHSREEIKRQQHRIILASYPDLVHMRESHSFLGKKGTIL